MAKPSLFTKVNVPMQDGFTTEIRLAEGNQKLIARVRGQDYATRLVHAANSIDDIRASAERSTDTLNQIFGVTDTLIRILDKLMEHFDTAAAPELPLELKMAVDVYKRLKERGNGKD